MNFRTCVAALFGMLCLAACQNTDNRKGFLGDYRIGERAQVGPMVYNVFETQYLVKLGEGANTRIPQHRFFLVRLSAVNGGAASSVQSIPTITLIDDSGTSYNELDNGAGVPEWLGMSRKVRPAESLSGEVVFDVPPKHYKLRIADEQDENYAFFDLPLSFGDAAPPVGGAESAPR